MLRCLSRHWLLILTFIVLGAFWGCMIIPTPEHTLLEGRGKIDDSDLAFLNKDKTSREEVVLRFGEPDLILDHDRILVYHWVVSQGYFFVGGGYSGAGGPISKVYIFMLEFDEHGLLKRFKRSGSVWTSAQARLDKWTPPGIERPPSANRKIFMIDPTPKTYTESGKLDTVTRPIRFRIGEFRLPGADPTRATFIGHKKAAFGVVVADVRTYRPFIDMVRSAITTQLEAAGHKLVGQGADVTVTGDITEFGVTTSVSLSSWDAIGSLDITVKVHSSRTSLNPLIRRYQAKHVSKTILGPSKEDFEQVMRDCLEDMQRQIVSDPEFSRLFNGG